MPNGSAATGLILKSHIPYRGFLRLAAALLLMMLAGAFAWQKLHSVSAPELTLNCLLQMQGIPKLPSEITLKNGDSLKFTLSSPQSGYLYVLEKGPALPNGENSFVVSFPKPSINSGSAAVAANREIWFEHYFVDPIGTETYWLIWSERSVSQLEEIKHYVDWAKRGVLSNANKVKEINAYLAAHPVAATIERNEAAKRTRFKQQGEVLVALVQLRHR